MSDAKPLPRITADNRPFWEAARRHELALQRCDDCARFRYPPAPVCPECLSERATWINGANIPIDGAQGRPSAF